MSVPPPELPSGLTARPFTLEDAAVVARLVGDCEEHEDGWREIEAADLQALWSLPDMDLSAQSLGVFDGERLVASADVRGEHAEVDVHPDARGRGIGSALLPWTWAQARAQGKARVSQSFSDARTDGVALFRANGYEAAWVGWSLRMPITGVAAPSLPDGYTFRSLDYAQDARDVFEVIHESFNEWRDEPPEDAWESWDGFIGSHGFLAPWGSPLVVHDGRVVGASIALDAGEGQDAWIQQLAVDSAHRGRGLGGALIRETYARFAARGSTHGALFTDSRTGALALYEHIGMSVRASYTHWVKQL